MEDPREYILIVPCVRCGDIPGRIARPDHLVCSLPLPLLLVLCYTIVSTGTATSLLYYCHPIKVSYHLTPYHYLLLSLQVLP